MIERLRVIALSAMLLAAPASSFADELLPSLADATTEFARRTAATEDTRCVNNHALLLPVELGPGTNVDAVFDETRSRLRLLYRMNFNQLTEGWNWHPEASLSGDDYYRHKFLPTGSVPEERPGYVHEDKIGEPQQIRVRWRYDYFFAFDNLYDFYPRNEDDDAGFAAEIPLNKSAAERLIHGDLRMALRGSLNRNCLSDSTTFWKATYSNPEDFTLKKRYLVGSLEEVFFYDSATRRILARIARKTPR